MLYNYVVIGAGVSGLYFSSLLKQVNPSIKILILESSHRVGGRILKEDRAQMGAKFVHDDFCRFFSKCNINKYSFRLGSLKNKSSVITESMRLEETGSISKKIHKDVLKYGNEANVPYDFWEFLQILKDDLQIKYKTPYSSYEFKNDYYLVNGKYKTEKIIFALPPNVLKGLDNPYRTLFRHWDQGNVITLAFMLDNKQNIEKLRTGFFFLEEFPKTSFYFDNQNFVLYVNLFNKYKNFSTHIIERKIVDKFSLKIYKLNKKEWSKGSHLQGAWTVPKSTLSPRIVETIEKGYNNSIFYLGDYLGDISSMGTVTSCMRSAERLVKRIYR